MAGEGGVVPGEGGAMAGEDWILLGIVGTGEDGIKSLVEVIALLEGRDEGLLWKGKVIIGILTSVIYFHNACIRTHFLVRMSSELGH